ncbi:hypothetical protein PF005_g7253 [Phytophthora fragariae]|uniref:Secreted protein n=1 Tax=Phytophthora fragariae TaxID=53985 RepID=A0A6A3T5N6_9STRA|nr:hypothetical protein PF003_g10094 [Phytophthora fragariae]KAE8945162.1 hypothetical protein PF009_g5173 [Phytophthora fragariae]KAE9020689.1 hypothetical protein PF011_g5292 [Phytophthora fragariae]KAE9122905.1 hypothetical protein PF010_g6580 [Phytophthora fragariae]KAE9129983.1 hypothetical protein PF007_g4693 [Phytophthora fragariae]
MRVEAIWLLSVFFTNCLTCHWGRNQIPDYFNCFPPSLNEYLDGIHVNVNIGSICFADNQRTTSADSSTSVLAS